MQFLENILAASQTAVLSAFILGLMTAISPCPLATNITAIGFISKKMKPEFVFISGLLYTLGRMASYFLLALLLYFSSDKLHISAFFQQHGEKMLGPLFIIIGLFMLGILKINMPNALKFTKRFENKDSLSFLDAFLIGFLFALAFCPYSGVLYFGMLIPMTISQPAGLLLPLIFALATSIPVIVIAWLLAFMLSGVGKFYNRLQSIEKIFRYSVAVLFIAAGVYYMITIYLD